jgi:hypothetical protein
MCKILVDVVEGGGGNGQKQVAKLGFFFLLSLSLLIEKPYIYLIMFVETKDEHFCPLLRLSL